MARLGKKEREAVVLRFFKEKSLREVAAATQVTEAAAQSRVHRALEKAAPLFCPTRREFDHGHHRRGDFRPFRSNRAGDAGKKQQRLPRLPRAQRPVVQP